VFSASEAQARRSRDASLVRKLQAPTMPASHSHSKTASNSEADPRTVARIAVGIDGYPEGRDAAVLAAAIAGVTDADLMLVAIHPDPLVVLPSGMDWKSLESRPTQR
jgi:hypothetical protein